MKKVMITGVTGLFGSYLEAAFKEKYEVCSVMGRSQLDVSCTEDVFKFIENEHPDLIVHSAGFRMVDEAEQNPEKVLLINAFGTKNIALASEKLGIPLVHISSDSVFDGATDKPYNEYDRTNPVNMYGYSKLMAENEVMRYHSKYFIVRVPLLFGVLGHKESNYIYIMADKIKKNETLTYTIDQICSPTYCKDAAEAIVKMSETNYYGVYHIANTGTASRFEFYKTCAEILKLPTDKMLGVPQREKLAKRSKNTMFSSITFKNTFGIELRDWRIALEECLKDGLS